MTKSCFLCEKLCGNKKKRWWWTFCAHLCVCPCAGVRVCQGVCTAALWQRSDISCSDILSQFISPASGRTEALKGHTRTSNTNLSFGQRQWGALRYISQTCLRKRTHSLSLWHTQANAIIHRSFVCVFSIRVFDVKWHGDCKVQTVNARLRPLSDKLNEQLKEPRYILATLGCAYLIFQTTVGPKNEKSSCIPPRRRIPE